MKLEWDYHVSSFLEALEVYINEIDYPITYSESQAVAYTWQLLNNPDTAIIVHLEDDKVVGGAVVMRNKEFYNEYFGYITKFYVLPEYRGTRVARAVMKEVIEWFDDNQCVISFATPSGVQYDQLFTNLLGKFGYRASGPLLTRKGNLT